MPRSENETMLSPFVAAFQPYLIPTVVIVPKSVNYGKLSTVRDRLAHSDQHCNSIASTKA